MSSNPLTSPTDRDCLEAWRRHRSSGSLRPLIERYLTFVYASALRRVGTEEHAIAVTRAVFLVLARRGHKLRKRTILPGWLFHVTSVACRKLAVKSPSRRGGGWFKNSPGPVPAITGGAAAWHQVAPELDAAIQRLPSARRDAVLLRALLRFDPDSSAGILRTTLRRSEKRFERGLNQIARRLRKRRVSVTPEELLHLCSANACVVPPPENLATEIVASVEEGLRGSTSFKLAQRTLNALAWARWRRRLAIGIPSVLLLLATLVGAAWYVDSLSGHSRLISLFLIWSVKHEGRTVPGLSQPARAWPANASTPQQSAVNVRTPHDLYQMTNIWLAHLKFLRPEWDALQPKRLTPLPHFLQPDGTVLLRHPDAQRSGLAGVLGFDFHWATADFEFGGIGFTNVAARIKGNGTYLTSLSGEKRPFKIDLNRFANDQRLGELDELNFNNLLNDFSCVSDALAYEFFREAGVPASRTAYAYLSVSVEGQWDKKPLGLYVMVEPVDDGFALERFGSRRTPLFKPVTYELFNYLGDDWSAYEGIYDLKTKATGEQQRRLIEFARLVTFASDADFARGLGDFLDLPAFARYLACEVLLSNYDGFLSNGQNFYLYLDPRSGKFGFIPWDLDLAWGGFFLLGTTKERERASIWHPWVGRHPFLQRVMAVPEFRRLYRAQLEELFNRLLVPRRLHERIDMLARILRSPIAAESTFRRDKFEQAVSARPLERSTDENNHGANRPAHQLKRFIEARSKSVRRQLDGQADGMVLERRERR